MSFDVIRDVSRHTSDADCSVGVCNTGAFANPNDNKIGTGNQLSSVRRQNGSIARVNGGFHFQNSSVHNTELFNDQHRHDRSRDRSNDEPCHLALENVKPLNLSENTDTDGVKFGIFSIVNVPSTLDIPCGISSFTKNLKVPVSIENLNNNYSNRNRELDNQDVMDVNSINQAGRVIKREKEWSPEEVMEVTNSNKFLVNDKRLTKAYVSLKDISKSLYVTPQHRTTQTKFDDDLINGEICSDISGGGLSGDDIETEAYSESSEGSSNFVLSADQITGESTDNSSDEDVPNLKQKFQTRPTNNRSTAVGITVTTKGNASSPSGNQSKNKLREELISDISKSIRTQRTNRRGRFRRACIGVSEKNDSSCDFASSDDRFEDESSNYSSEEDFVPNGNKPVTTKSTNRRSRLAGLRATKKSKVIGEFTSSDDQFEDQSSNYSSDEDFAPNDNKPIAKSKFLAPVRKRVTENSDASKKFVRCNDQFKERSHNESSDENVASNVQKSAGTNGRALPGFNKEKAEKNGKKSARESGGISGLKTSVCPICNKNMLSRNMRSHMRLHTGEHRTFDCPTCGKTFKRRNHLEIHKLIHEKLKPYKCMECGKCFRQAGNMTSHMRLHTGEKPFGCDVCDRRFRLGGDLTKHKRIHTDERPYKCDKCDAAFRCAGNLKGHKRLHSGETPYACHICGKKYRTHVPRSHIQTHTGEKTHYCVKCDKGFITSAALKSHIGYLHTAMSDLPCGCHLCDRRFVHLTALKRHLLSHSGERPFMCPQCGNSYHNKNHLNRHIKTHDPTYKYPKKERKYKCHICGKSYCGSQELKRHISTHRDYPCAVSGCLRIFTKAKALQAHLRSHNKKRKK